MSRITIDNKSELTTADALQLCTDLINSFMTTQDGLIESPCGRSVKYSRERYRGGIDHMFTVENKKSK